MSRFLPTKCGLFLTLLLASGCASPASDVSTSLTFDRASEKAVVILGTTNHRLPSGPEDGALERPDSLATHWQQYDPRSLQLIPDAALMMSLRFHNAWESATLRDDYVHVLEVEPGDYALIAVTADYSITSFFPLNDGSGGAPRRWGSPYKDGLKMQGQVDPKKHFRFSVGPGQIVYIGHFDFLHPGGGIHRIVDIKYSVDAAAARAALQDYPGITGEMAIFDLSLSTEQAAR
jgi:hypothetical protein